MDPGGGGQQPPLHHPRLPAVSARDLFPDGAFVRLQNRAQKTYLTADDDGEGVSLRQHGPAFSLNAVWRAHHVAVDGVTFVLLQGAAYGRYLAVAPGRAPSGCRGSRAVQRNYGGAGADVAAVRWRPFRMSMIPGEKYIVLRHDFDRNLRANGKYRFWHTAVTVDDKKGKWSTMMQWTVARFQLAPELPPLPPPTMNLGAPSGLLRRRKPEPDEQRTIRHVRANDEGDFDQNENWAEFPFLGRSVFNLMTLLGLRQPGGEVGVGITLAVRPGSQGRLTPLVTDLPRSVDTMDIVVFRSGTQRARNFLCPDINELQTRSEGAVGPSLMSPAETLIDDLLTDILIRLPPNRPHNLVNSALVCKQWARVATSPSFRSQFYNFNCRGVPPVLGFFLDTRRISDSQRHVISRFVSETNFHPLPCDRRSSRRSCLVLDSHHSRVLWSPMQRRWGPFPNNLWVWCAQCGEEVQLPRVRRCPSLSWSTSLVCGPSAYDGADHSCECHYEAFRVVLLGGDDNGMFTTVYASDTGAWNPPIAAVFNPPVSSIRYRHMATARLGNHLLFMLNVRAAILRFDMADQSFEVIQIPECCQQHNAVPIVFQDGRFGFAALNSLRLQVWSRPLAADGGGDPWTQLIDTELDREFAVLDPEIEDFDSFLVGSVDSVGLLLWTYGGLFSVSIESNQVIINKELNNPDRIGSIVRKVVPFATYCTPVWRGRLMRVNNGEGSSAA